MMSLLLGEDTFLPLREVWLPEPLRCGAVIRLLPEDDLTGAHRHLMVSGPGRLLRDDARLLGIWISQRRQDCGAAVLQGRLMASHFTLPPLAHLALARSRGWIPAAPHPDEAERLAALEALQILDTDPDPRFDHIVQQAARALDMPIALVSLVDAHRQWFKATCGLATRETGRDEAFCAHTILESGMLVVEDARCDPRFSGNPLVVGPSNMIFYAGVPLRTSSGQPLGTLCVIDHAPRQLSSSAVEVLLCLAARAEDVLCGRDQATLPGRICGEEDTHVTTLDDDVAAAGGV